MKKTICILLALALLVSLGGCTQEDSSADTTTGAAAQSAEWAIYWYLCGSDLESENGCATQDMAELMETVLPDNVTLVIETGGAYAWQNDFVDATQLQRWVYAGDTLTLVDEQPSASMGEASTLADFLRFSGENYPAEKTAVVFWNHGGGSVTGAAFDEVYGDDSLTCEEMREAFGAVYTLDAQMPPLELVGFDTCLMATVDVASAFSDIAHYLVASEESEPGNGWYYSQWTAALAADPQMDGAALGQVICDTYYAGCELVGTQDSTTLSLTDLSKLGGLLDAYETFGAQALAAACEDPAFFASFGRAAVRSENYGGNTREQGYSNMVDLGHLARETSALLPAATDVLAALDECVLYRVNGQYRQEATGLSCYYSYNGDTQELADYLTQGTSDAFKYFYTYELTGELPEDGMQYVGDYAITELLEVPTLPQMGWDGMLLTLSEDGTTYITLGEQADDVLQGIGFSLYYMDEENDLMMLLGSDNDMNADWENGVFSDNFRGVWGAIDGCLVYMELSYEGEDYNLYSVPVLLNGEEYNLQVVYSFTEEAWSILGARQGIDDSGMADKELRLLEVGDEITTLWYASTYFGEDDFEACSAETLTVTEQTTFAEQTLPDGEYSMTYEMYDAMGNYAYSDSALFTCENGEITTTIFE